MWILSSNLPLLIGDLVPSDNEKWECFLLLLDVIQLCTTRAASSAQAGFLEALIHDHHQQFVRCYSPEKVTPKVHYMVHFPQQIIRYWPILVKQTICNGFFMQWMYVHIPTLTELDPLSIHGVCAWKQRTNTSKILLTEATSKMYV